MKRPNPRRTVPATPIQRPEGSVNDDLDEPRTYARYQKLRAFKGPNAERDAFHCGMWLAAISGNERAARWCATHNIQVRAMSEGVNTQGGVLVPTILAQRIIDQREEHGVFRQHAFIEPMSSDVVDISRQTSGLTPVFVGEGVSITESTSAWDAVKLVAKKLAAETRTSSELEEDAMINLADRFAIDVGKGFAEKEDQCGFNGTGTSTFGGIFGLTEKIDDGTHTASIITTSTLDSFAEVTNDELTKMVGALPEFAQENAKWFCSRVGWAAVFQRLAVAGGGNTIQTLTGPKIERSYMGYPIVISQVLPTSTAATGLNGDIAFLLGDLSLSSTMGTRRDITLKRSEEKHWSTDEIAYKATERFEIVNHNLGDTSDAGPMIGWKGLT